VSGQKMLTKAQAEAINERVLKHTSVERREVEEGRRRCAGPRSSLFK
jgi:hypothetical protein